MCFSNVNKTFATLHMTSIVTWLALYGMLLRILLDENTQNTRLHVMGMTHHTLNSIHYYSLFVVDYPPLLTCSTEAEEWLSDVNPEVDWEYTMPALRRSVTIKSMYLKRHHLGQFRRLPLQARYQASLACYTGGLNL